MAGPDYQEDQQLVKQEHLKVDPVQSTHFGQNLSAVGCTNDWDPASFIGP
jgi:hypothetical protein